MTNARPRVGVGVPVFNGERYLAETLDSLLAQTYDDFALIIGDNGSTDRTEEIARDYARRDPRIEYLRHSENSGSARNYSDLFHRARTEYFRWHAADDLSLPAYTARCVDVLDADPRVALAYCKTTDIDHEGAEIGPYEDRMHAPQEQASDRFLHVMKHLQRCNAVYGLMRSSLVARTRLMGPYLSSDRCFLAELALYGKLIEVPERCFLRRYHEGASSAMTPAELLSFFSARPAAPTLHTPRLWWGYWSAAVRAPLPLGEAARLQLFLLKRAYWDKGIMAREAASVLRHRLGLAVQSPEPLEPPEQPVSEGPARRLL